MATMKRKPAQVDPSDEQVDLSDALQYDDIAASDEALGASGNDQVSLEELSIEAQKPPKPPVEGLDEKSISQITRAFTGASPALMGLLFGGSPSTVERELKETKDYYKAGVPTKTVLTKGPTGEPIYTDIRDSIGQEAYERPYAESSTGNGKWLTGKAWVKDENGVEQLTDILTNNASNVVINAITKEPITSARSYITPKTYLTEDIRGQKNVGVIDPSLRGKAMINKEPLEGGIGGYYNVKTKGQALTIEKGFEEGQKQSQALATSLVDIKSAKDVLKTSRDPREVAQAIYGMVRSLETKGVLTDQDFSIITGSNLEPYLNELQYKIETKAFGNVESLRNSYLKLADAIEKKTANKLGALSKTYAPSTKQAQEGFKSVTPVVNKAQIHPESDAALKWAKSNPKDPRSKKILEALGAR
jgi:hypothetical protein